MPRDNDKVTLSMRLAYFGLERHKNELKALNVKDGAKVRLDPQDKRHAPRVHRLKVNSVADLKRWVGVPDGAVGQNTPAPLQRNRFISAESPLLLPFPPIPIEDPETRAHLTMYLMRPTSKKVTPAEKNLIAQLDKEISRLGIAISIFLAADIHIEEGATLYVDQKIQVLFANAIVLENGSSIQMESSFAKIDCARLHYVES